MATINGLNAHDRPPDKVRDVYKQYQHIKLSEVERDEGIIDLEKLDMDNLPALFALSGFLDSTSLRLAFDGFAGKSDAAASSGQIEHGGGSTGGGGLIENIPIFTHEKVTGLRMIPSLYPPTVQRKLLDLMLHRDLSNPAHKTNLHLHYDIEYPKAPEQLSSNKPDEAHQASSYDTSSASFFEVDPMSTFQSRDPQVHKPMSVQSMLDKKLRWITLGGQYDWTSKVYPEGEPPPFPEDIAQLLRATFPETEAQAAIVNFYSANDTLSMHRDVSEDCDIGLISVSIGCDALFMISHDDGEGCEVVRLRSGDAVYMSGRSRFAWHGVPKIIPETCPGWLRDWPGPRYPYWQGWMGRKRINLNVRQMTESGLLLSK